MRRQFKKHYTLDEARALLPHIRKWLEDLDRYQDDIKKLDRRVGNLMNDGADVGGASVNQLVRTLAGCKDILQHFRSREIQLKDLSRGLIDFPSIRNGREIFLCWEKDEDDIEFWHDLETGYAGRERL